ncbi:MAG TPA: hypothetical protein VLP43_03940 [Solirubrobacteraceae bacterium]|nr:hypothetical protein [Solirubrobacteraceae bacterium]
MNRAAKRRASPAVTICVQRHPRGDWEVIGPDRQARISCETLEDARRIAHLSLIHAHSGELIVRDAYNRIVEHELLHEHRVGASSPGSQHPR